MGIRLFGNSVGRLQCDELLPTDPRPDVFVIRQLVQVNQFVVGEVHYPHATNFEGDKIIVWKDATVQEVKQYSIVDPHFLQDNKVFARFRPTSEGLTAAISFCASQQQK